MHAVMPFFDSATVSLVRNQAFDAEQTGVPSAEVQQIMTKLGLFKLFVPEQLGGQMIPLPDAIRLIEEAAYIDGSFGWLTSIGAGGGYFSAYYEPAVAGRLFGPAEAVVAGSGHPTGTARRVENGYQVTGRWRYCSGSAYATLFTASCRITDDAGQLTNTVRAFTFRPEQVTILPDWNAFGLKATNSHSIDVVDAFVPHELVFDLSRPPIVDAGPIFSYPFLPFAKASFAAVCIGIGRHFLDEATQLAQQYRTSWEGARPERFHYVREQMGQQKNRFERRITSFYEALDESWSLTVAGHAVSDALSQKVGDLAREATVTVLTGAQQLFPHLGMAVVDESTAINRAWRDVHTASQHTLLKAYPVSR
ncbi:acyl-CoA dehydrogenase [Fibrisoma montanum]|uniref:Acyl-CoA dehydrogenase n=2 Tax=Fibrisoma montanum TaxID=2305895 RepID=A0A418M8A7_9BACT|nr:acyl-CoA dehydrogenase [Fibrisoma montanum]